MLTGEYFVLDGALALALPCKLGQSLQVQPTTAQIDWLSYDETGKPWFKARFSTPDCNCLEATDGAIANRLTEILQTIEQLQPGFWKKVGPVEIRTILDFPRKWGLGTSSTLIANLAAWAKVDPYLLLENTFGGSGYDIACAVAGGPIYYQRLNNLAEAYPVKFDPTFKEQLYFVYLGNKQNSREGIARYRKRPKRSEWIDEISAISRQIATVQQLEDFEDLIRQHESIVASTIDLEPVKKRHFSDFWGEVKSLGAWGGDFVLATSSIDALTTSKYFNERGLETVIPYEEMIKA